VRTPPRPRRSAYTPDSTIAMVDSYVRPLSPAFRSTDAEWVGYRATGPRSPMQTKVLEDAASPMAIAGEPLKSPTLPSPCVLYRQSKSLRDLLWDRAQPLFVEHFHIPRKFHLGDGAGCDLPSRAKNQPTTAGRQGCRKRDRRFQLRYVLFFSGATRIPDRC
jgi:hypothetical protein